MMWLRNSPISRFFSHSRFQFRKFPFIKINEYRIERNGICGFTQSRSITTETPQSSTGPTTSAMLPNEDHQRNHFPDNSSMLSEVSVEKPDQGGHEIDFESIVRFPSFPDFLQFLRVYRIPLSRSLEARKRLIRKVNVRKISPDSIALLSNQEIYEFLDLVKIFPIISRQLNNDVITTFLKRLAYQETGEKSLKNENILKTLRAFTTFPLSKENQKILLELIGKLDKSELTSSFAGFLYFIGSCEYLYLTWSDVPRKDQLVLFNLAKFESDLSSLPLPQCVNLLRQFSNMHIYLLPDERSDALFKAVLLNILEETSLKSPLICNNLIKQLQKRGVTWEQLSKDQVLKMFDQIESCGKLGGKHVARSFLFFSQMGFEYRHPSLPRDRLNQLLIEIGRSTDLTATMMFDQLNILLQGIANIGCSWKELPPELKFALLKLLHLFLTHYINDQDAFHSKFVNSIRLMGELILPWEEIPSEIRDEFLLALNSLLNENFDASSLIIVRKGLKRMGFDYSDEIKRFIESLAINATSSSEIFTRRLSKIFHLLFLCNSLEFDLQTKETLAQKIFPLLDSIDFQQVHVVATIAADTSMKWDYLPSKYQVNFANAILSYLGKPTEDFIEDRDILQVLCGLVKLNPPFHLSQVKFTDIVIRTAEINHSSFPPALWYLSNHLRWKHLNLQIRKRLLTLIHNRFEMKDQYSLKDHAAIAVRFSTMTFDCLQGQKSISNQDILGIHKKILQGILPFLLNDLEDDFVAKYRIALYLEYLRTLPAPLKQTLLTSIHRKEFPFIVTSTFYPFKYEWTSLSEELQDHLKASIKPILFPNQQFSDSIEVIPSYNVHSNIKRLGIPIAIKWNGKAIALLVNAKYFTIAEGKRLLSRKDSFFEYLFRFHCPDVLQYYRVEESGLLTKEARTEVVQTVGENLVKLISSLVDNDLNEKKKKEVQ